MAEQLQQILKALDFLIDGESNVKEEVWIELPSLPGGKSPVCNSPSTLQTEEETDCDSFSDGESDGEDEICRLDLDSFIDVKDLDLEKKIDECGLFEKQNKKKVYDIYWILLKQSNYEEYKFTKNEAIDRLLSYTGFGLSLLLEIEIEKDSDFRIIEVLNIWKEYTSDVKFDIGNFKELIITSSSDMNFVTLKGTPMPIYVLEMLRTICHPKQVLNVFIK